MTKTIQSAKNVLNVLAALNGHSSHGLTPTDLVKATGFRPSNITRYVATLEEKGFIERIPETGRIKQTLWHELPRQESGLAAQVKAMFRAKGETITDWAKENGYRRHDVYQVLNGQSKARWGKGHEIAVKLAAYLSAHLGGASQ
jgi:gp16 family phage-associated protein